MQASESFKRVQAKILNQLKSEFGETSREDLTTEMFTKRDTQDPKQKRQYTEMMKAAELEILIAE